MPVDAPPKTLVVALALLLLGPALSGCLGTTPDDVTGTSGDGTGEAQGDDPLAASHHIDRIEEYSVTPDDGVTLRGHVYLPDAEEPHAVILNYAPYWNGGLGGDSGEQTSDDGDAMASSAHGNFERLLEAGYAVALVNIRGTGISDGCNHWLHHGDDGADAYTVIEDLANQSWANGNVGMVGISWHGYTQYAAQAHNPPSLKAVAPASAIVDTWNLFTRYGAPITTQFGPMATTYAGFQANIIGLPGEFPVNRAECPEHAEQVQQFNQLTTHGDKTPWFQERTAHEILNESDAANFVTNGLTRFSEGHALQVEGLWPNLNDESRLMLGQWGHSFPTDDKREWYWDTLVKWFDHHLRDGPKDFETNLVQYEDDDGNWYEAPRWPPASETERVHLGDGTVRSDGDAVSSATQAFQAGDVDERPNACTTHKALYVSPPVEEDVLLAGNFDANVTVTSTAPRSNFGVYVWAVDEVDPCPDATERAEPTSYPDEVSRALSDLRHRGYMTQGEPFPVGEPGLMQMHSHPFANHVSAGERLVVGVTGGAVELSNEDPDPVLAVETGPDVKGWIDLPVVEGNLTFQDADAGGGPLAPP